MTIRELYIFAQSHTLIDKSVGLVIDEYIKHISVHNHTLTQNNIMSNQDSDMSNLKKDLDNKVEFRTEDVLELFST